MAESDILVLPSIAEATPLVLLEAMSKGLPWIASETCGSASELAGGVIVAQGGFAAAIAQLLSNAGLAGRAGPRRTHALRRRVLVGRRRAALPRGARRSRLGERGLIAAIGVERVGSALPANGRATELLDGRGSRVADPCQEDASGP